MDLYYQTVEKELMLGRECRPRPLDAVKDEVSLREHLGVSGDEILDKEIILNFMIDDLGAFDLSFVEDRADDLESRIKVGFFVIFSTGCHISFNSCYNELYELNLYILSFPPKIKIARNFNPVPLKAQNFCSIFMH